jgi:hypothetical protein
MRTSTAMSRTGSSTATGEQWNGVFGQALEIDLAATAARSNAQSGPGQATAPSWSRRRLSAASTARRDPPVRPRTRARARQVLFCSRFFVQPLQSPSFGAARPPSRRCRRRRHDTAPEAAGCQ